MTDPKNTVSKVEETENTQTPTTPEQTYLETRWQSQKNYYSKNSGKNKKQYQQIQLTIGAGAIIVPLLLGIPDIPKWVPAIISAMVAVLAATENVYQFGDNWRNFRQASESLKRERALFDAEAGPYRISKDPFRRFVERCEDVIAAETGQYFQREGESADKEDKKT